jgi:hypothetical protein
MIRLYIPSGTFVAFYPVQHNLARLVAFLPMAWFLRSLDGCCQDSGREGVPVKNGGNMTF